MRTAQTGDQVRVHYVKGFQDGSVASPRGRSPIDLTVGVNHPLPGLGLRGRPGPRDPDDGPRARGTRLRASRPCPRPAPEGAAGSRTTNPCRSASGSPS